MMSRSLIHLAGYIFISVIPIVVLLGTPSASAQTTVGGTISTNTTWAAINSPYLVTDHVTVSNGVTLTIEPAVQVRFRGYHKFDVKGLLLAVGTQTDQILFTRDQSIEGHKWWGLRFLDADDNSTLKYCTVEWGNSDGDSYEGISMLGGVFTKDCSPIIDHSSFAHNEAPGPPTIETLVAMYLYGYAGTVSNCEVNGRFLISHPSGTVQILNNTILQGIRCNTGGNITITGNNVRNDNSSSATFGDGIYCESTNATISNNDIHDSFSGINLSQCDDVTISRNLIYDNSATYGGGIKSSWSNVTVSNNTIDNNSANFEGGGIDLVNGGDVSIFNNIVSNSVNGEGVAVRATASQPTVDLRYNDVWNNASGNYLNVSPGAGEISSDPIFSSGSNYNLQSNSPCIDTGDPSSPLDPDLTRADMGALPFDGPVPVELVFFTANFVRNGMSLTWQTATETNNFGFEIERRITKEWLKIGFVEGNGTTVVPQNYSFKDSLQDVSRDISVLQYRLKQVDTDGSFEYSPIITAELIIPNKFELSQNYPNPFNPSTEIRFQLPKGSFVDLTIYNTLGQVLRRLLSQDYPAGKHAATWDGRDETGHAVSSGIYLYKIQAGEFSEVKKMSLLR